MSHAAADGNLSDATLLADCRRVLGAVEPLVEAARGRLAGRLRRDGAFDPAALDG